MHCNVIIASCLTPAAPAQETKGKAEGKGSNSLLCKCAMGLKVLADVHISDISNEEFDMIVLPGGGEGAQHLRDNFVLEAMLKSQKRRGGWIAGICASPSIVMASIGLIPEGAAATCYPAPSFQKIMTDNKVEYQDEDVVVVEEQKIITSKSPGTALHFALKCGEKLHGKKAADKVKSAILFNCCG